ncbi:MAG: hypothetical protein V7723_19115 [Sneathiella sp.]|uniref:hypothetical protein n=1 Tax=Sneathiella sp. TaxID=1964365 RepID=UPI003003A667
MSKTGLPMPVFTTESLTSLSIKELRTAGADLYKVYRDRSKLRSQNKITNEELDSYLINIRHQSEILEIELKDRIEMLPPPDAQTNQEKQGLRVLDRTLKGVHATYSSVDKAMSQ